MDLRIALAGNPNSGKTTLFNALTGANQFVGNWPGVTVEKKEGKLKKHLEDLGFVAGGEVQVINTLSGNIIVNVKDTRVALSKELAAKIMV